MRGRMNWVSNWDLWSATRWTDIATFQYDALPLLLNRLTVLGLAVFFTVLTVRLFERRERDATRTLLRLRPGALAGALVVAAAVPGACRSSPAALLGCAGAATATRARRRRRRRSTTGARTSRRGRTRRCPRSPAWTSTCASTRRGTRTRCAAAYALENRTDRADRALPRDGQPALEEAARGRSTRSRAAPSRAPGS